MPPRPSSVLVMSACLAAASCTQTTALSEVPIRVGGSSTVFPITEAAATEFSKGTSGVRFEQSFSGTTAGFQRFCEGKLDIQNASRPIRAAEDQAWCARGVT